VLRHHVDADVVFVGGEEEEPWRRNLELQHHRIRISNGGSVQRLLNVHAPFHLGPEITQSVECVGDILRTERRTVAPLDALTGLDGELLEVRVNWKLSASHMYILSAKAL